MNLLHPLRWMRNNLNEYRYRLADTQYRLGFGWAMARYYIDRHPVDMTAAVVGTLEEDQAFKTGAMSAIDQIKTNQMRESAAAITYFSARCKP